MSGFRPSDHVQSLYRQFGPPKPMGSSAGAPDRPHFFLHRKFLGEQDLAILFNTKRCRYQCRFCALPDKSSLSWIGADHVLQQFTYVVDEVKHSLGVLDRLTIANEGSVLDATTFPAEALTGIVEAARVLPSLRKVVIETRIEFAQIDRLVQLRAASGKQIDVLTGFETLDTRIRDEILGKRETLSSFLSGLDRVAEAGAELTTYILYKPSPYMTDDDARTEAAASIDFVRAQCAQRAIPLIIRLNPMYVSRNTPWARLAESIPDYRPPRLTDVVELAEQKRRNGARIYLGLTSEGLSDVDGTYRGREDFSPPLLKRAIVANTSGST